MNASKAKELLLPISKEDFLTERFTNDIGKCCAVGHLARLTSDDPSDYALENCADSKSNFFHSVAREEKQEVFDFARTETNKFLVEKYGNKCVDYNLASVNNDDNVNGYNQDNPKDRVIALLDDMIEAGY